jgi:hypothetical protein
MSRNIWGNDAPERTYSRPRLLMCPLFVRLVIDPDLVFRHSEESRIFELPAAVCGSSQKVFIPAAMCIASLGDKLQGSCLA